MRDKSALFPQIAMVGTPEDDYLWLEDFIHRHEGDRLKIYRAATMENAANLGADYVENLKASLDPKAYRLYVLGEMIRLSGDLFYYAYEPRINDYPVEFDREAGPVHVGLDFNVGRMSMTFSQFHGAGFRKQMAIFDELILEDNASNTEDAGRAIYKRHGDKELILTIDSAAKNRTTSAAKINGVIQTDANILKNMGFQVRYMRQNPPLRKRQLQVNGLLAKRRILINPVTCPMTKRDFQRVEQDKISFEKAKDKDHKLTHLSDGVDYICGFEFPYPKDGNAKDGFRAGKL